MTATTTAAAMAKGQMETPPEGAGLAGSTSGGTGGDGSGAGMSGGGAGRGATAS